MGCDKAVEGGCPAGQGAHWGCTAHRVRANINMIISPFFIDFEISLSALSLGIIIEELC